ncbi:MAG: cytochrome P450 [Acidimicrobiales bacterium]
MPDVPRPPIADWATDFDHTHPDYAAAAPEIWDELRETCPVAHTERFGGAWLPTRHEDVAAIAKDTHHFTSQGIIVTDWRPEAPRPMGYAPPITSDPPFHAIARKFLLEFFSPKAIEGWESTARDTCRELIDDIKTRGLDTVDAATEYAQHIPVKVIADMLGLPREDGDKFRVFIHRIMEEPGQNTVASWEDTLDYYLDTRVKERRENLGDDLISYLCTADIDGMALQDEHVRGTIALLIIAGIDTTWSGIGSSLWHMAQHPVDRKRWITDPDVRPFALEEFLRFYAPVTMARLVAEDVEVGGCPMKEGDWTLLPFPAANRDPEAFEHAGEFIIDRQRNRHTAFGLGIHRCVGSNLARMEMRVALEEWMDAFPDFELADAGAVTWSTGQVRGPRSLPVRLGPAAASTDEN